MVEYSMSLQCAYAGERMIFMKSPICHQPFPTCRMVYSANDSLDIPDLVSLCKREATVSYACVHPKYALHQKHSVIRLAKVLRVFVKRLCHFNVAQGDSEHFVVSKQNTSNQKHKQIIYVFHASSNTGENARLFGVNIGPLPANTLHYSV